MDHRLFRHRAAVAASVPVINPADYSPLVWMKADGTLWQDSARTTPASANNDPVGAADDASGNSRHFTQATEGKRFALKTNIWNSKPAIRSDGSDDILRSASFTQTQPLTVYLVAIAKNDSGTGFACDGNAYDKCIIWEANGTTWKLRSNNTTACESSGGINVAEVVAAVFNGASSLIECGDRTAVTGTIGTNGFTDGACLGGDGAGFVAPGNYDFLEYMVFAGTHDLTTRNLFRAYFNSTGRWKHPTFNVRCIGDSITAGTGSTGGNNYPAVLQGLLGGGYAVDNLGSGGATAATTDAAFLVGNTRRMSGLRGCVALIFCGTNDIAGGATDADAYASNLSMWQKTRAAGKYAIAFTMLPRTDFNGTQEAYRVAFNTAVRDASAEYDALVDVAIQPELDDASDATYFSVDGVHLVNAGYAVIAGLANSAIQGLG